MTADERRLAAAAAVVFDLAAHAHDRRWTDTHLAGLRESMPPKEWGDCAHELLRALLTQVVKPAVHQDDARGGTLRRRLEIAAAQSRAAAKSDHE